MRTIRLRVWHKRRAMMYYHVEYTSYADGSAGVTMLEENDRLFPPDESEIETMEWTGKHDKEQETIWEDDIVEIEGVGRAQVIMKDGQWVTYREDHDEVGGSLYGWLVPLLVIGDIHANPDLLTASEESET